MGRLGGEPSRASAANPPAPVWRLGALIGGGGRVFEAVGLAPARPAVVKLLPWAAGLGADLVRNFTREARAVAVLRHPHVAEVLDVGALADGTPFVLMERLDGWTLEEVVAAGHTLSTAELLPIVRGITSALSAAYAAGVVHGELRADNVFLVRLDGYPGGFPKLLDFGVARLTAGAVKDAQADQRALAALAHRLLAAPPAPAVDAVLRRAMSPRSEDRFASVASFFGALEAAAGTAPPALPAPIQAAVVEAPAPPEPPAVVASDTSAAGRETEVVPRAAPEPAEASAIDLDRVPRRRAPWLVAAALGVAATAVVAGAARWLFHDEAPSIDVRADAPAAPGSGAPATAAAPARAPAATGERGARRPGIARSGRRSTDPPPYTPAATAAPSAAAGAPATAGPVPAAPSSGGAAPAAPRAEAVAQTPAATPPSSSAAAAAPARSEAAAPSTAGQAPAAPAPVDDSAAHAAAPSPEKPSPAPAPEPSAGSAPAAPAPPAAPADDDPDLSPP